MKTILLAILCTGIFGCVSAEHVLHGETGKHADEYTLETKLAATQGLLNELAYRCEAKSQSKGAIK